MDSEQFRCPVCLLSFCGAIIVCPNGHSVCNDCYISMRKKTCPLCRVGMKGIRNYHLESLASNIIFPCHFNEFGCEFKGKSSQMVAHNKFCSQQPVACICPRVNTTCNWKGPLRNVLEHLSREHQMFSLQKIKLGDPVDINWTYSTREQCMLRGKDTLLLWKELNRLFYVAISKVESEFLLAVLWLPLSHDAALRETNVSVKLTCPLENNGRVVCNVFPSMLQPQDSIEAAIHNMIEQKNTFELPIQIWKSRHCSVERKLHFRIAVQIKILRGKRI